MTGYLVTSCLASALTILHLCFARDVPAKVELCQRYNIGCQTHQELSTAAPRASFEGGQNNVQKNYCGMYEPHFLYFCVGENPGGNKEDIDRFCYTFRGFCGVPGGPPLGPPGLSGEITFSPEKCDQYGAMAVTMCTGKEQDTLRQLCQLYKQNCQPLTAASSLRGNPMNADVTPEERLDLCKQYAPLIKKMCTGEVREEAKEMCNLYKSFCHGIAPADTGHPGVLPGRPAVRVASSQVKPQDAVPQFANVKTTEGDMTQGSKLNVVTPERMATGQLSSQHLCKEYAPLMQQSCTGKEQGQILTLCNLYKKTCLGMPASQAAEPSQSIPAGSPGRDPLLLTPEGTGINALPPGHLTDLCTQYAALIEAKCTGNEQGQISQLCELYKMHCGQLKVPGAPLPEGSVHAPVAATSLRLYSLEHAGAPSPAQGKILCKEYEQMASTLCTGNEEGKLRQACDVYRTNCLFGEQIPAQQFPVSETTGVNPAGFGSNGFLPLMTRILPHHLLYCKRFLMSFAKFCLDRPPTDALFFCLAYGERCFPGVFNAARIAATSQQPIWAAHGAPGSWDVPLLCLNFKDISERYCTGYEPEFLREYCNVYRIICLV